MDELFDTHLFGFTNYSITFLRHTATCETRSLFIDQLAAKYFGAKTTGTFSRKRFEEVCHFVAGRGLTSTKLDFLLLGRLIFIYFATYCKGMSFWWRRCHRRKQHLSLGFSPHATQPPDARVNGFQLTANNDDHKPHQFTLRATVRCRLLSEAPKCRHCFRGRECGPWLLSNSCFAFSSNRFPVAPCVEEDPVSWVSL